MNSTANGVLLLQCNIFSKFYKVIDGSPSDVYLANHIFTCAMNVIITQIATVSLNVSTVFIFWQSTRLKERVAFFLIMVQSVIDFGVGIVAGSIFTFFLASEIKGRASC